MKPVRSDLETLSQADMRKGLLEAAEHGLYVAQSRKTILGYWRCSGLSPWDKGRIINTPELVHDFPTQEKKSRQPSLRFGISERVVTSRECLDKRKLKKQTSNQDPKKSSNQEEKGRNSKKMAKK